MAATASDERREVTKRLRDWADDQAESGEIDFKLCECEVTGSDPAHAHDRARHIADLIDPTCHARGYGHPDEFRVVKGCGVCHCGWYEDVYGRPYAYCPHCGARLVERGERDAN